MKRLICSMMLVTPLFLGLQAYAGGAKTATHEELAAQVTLEEFKKIVAEKAALIIDVNGTPSFDKAHVPGAVSFALVEGKMTSVLPADKSKLIVAYCGGTMCTAWEAAAKEAKQLGYTNIKHFKGGIKGWTDAGMPTEGAKTAKKGA